MNYPWKHQVLKLPKSLPKWARVLSRQGLTYELLSYYLSEIHVPLSKSLWCASLRCTKMGVLNTLGSSSCSSLDFVFNDLSRADVKSSRSVHSCLKFICPLHYADVGEINRDLSIFFNQAISMLESELKIVGVAQNESDFNVRRTHVGTNYSGRFLTKHLATALS